MGYSRVNPQLEPDIRTSGATCAYDAPELYFEMIRKDSMLVICERRRGVRLLFSVFTKYDKCKFLDREARAIF